MKTKNDGELVFPALWERPDDLEIVETHVAPPEHTVDPCEAEGWFGYKTVHAIETIVHESRNPERPSPPIGKFLDHWPNQEQISREAFDLSQDILAEQAKRHVEAVINGRELDALRRYNDKYPDDWRVPYGTKGEWMQRAAVCELMHLKGMNLVHPYAPVHNWVRANPNTGSIEWTEESEVRDHGFNWLPDHGRTRKKAEEWLNHEWVEGRMEAAAAAHAMHECDGDHAPTEGWGIQWHKLKSNTLRDKFDCEHERITRFRAIKEALEFQRLSLRTPDELLGPGKIWEPTPEDRRRDRLTTLRQRWNGPALMNHRGEYITGRHDIFRDTNVEEHAALLLLRRMVTSDGFREYLRRGLVSIHGASGLTYVVKRHGNVVVWWKGQMVAGLCIHLDLKGMPPTDDVVAKLLMVECDEPSIWHKSNVSWYGSTHRIEAQRFVTEKLGVVIKDRTAGPMAREEDIAALMVRLHRHSAEHQARLNEQTALAVRAEGA